MCELPPVPVGTEQLRISSHNNSSKFTLRDKSHFYSKQRQISMLYLTSLQCLGRVGRRNGCVELCLGLTQQRNGIAVGLIALLNLAIGLHSSVQNVVEIGSLWRYKGGKKGVYIILKHFIQVCYCVICQLQIMVQIAVTFWHNLS